MSPKIVNKTKKREEIANVAIETFAENGFESTSMNLIASRAGIGKGTLYQYFKSREELIFTAIEVCLSNHSKNLHKNLAGKGNCRKKLFDAVCSFVEYFFENHVSQGFLIQSTHLLSRTIYHDRVIKQFSEYRERFRSTIAQHIEKGCASGEFNKLSEEEIYLHSMNLVSFADGLFSTCLLLGSKNQLKNFCEAFLNSLFAYIANNTKEKK